MIKKIVFMLGPLMCFFIVLGFVQQANGAPPFAIDSVIDRLSEFRYTFDDTIEVISFFRETELSSYLVAWDTTLTGIDGFITNVNNTVTGFFSLVAVLFRVVIKGLWTLITDTLSLFGNLLFLFLDLLGLSHYIPSSAP